MQTEKALGTDGEGENSPQEAERRLCPSMWPTTLMVRAWELWRFGSSQGWPEVKQACREAVLREDASPMAPQARCPEPPFAFAFAPSLETAVSSLTVHHAGHEAHLTNTHELGKGYLEVKGPLKGRA